MKTLIVMLMLVALSFTGQAQGITELEETKIGYAPIILEQTNNLDEYRYKVNDDSAEAFMRDPIGFVEAYFDIANFIEQVKDKNYDTYLVRFATTKGYLEADYSKDGELNRTRQAFKDIALPQAVRNELFRQTEGWTMVKNSYRAMGKGNLLENENYRIKVVKNDQSKIIKIDPKNIGEERIAGM